VFIVLTDLQALACGGLSVYTKFCTLSTAALVGSAAVILWYLKKRRQEGDPSPRSMRSVNLDIGEVIHIDQWQPDGTASVKYRGAQWSVMVREGVHPSPGPHRVSELVGNRLLVDKA
jgi:membrane protein implicated in regulation of membrane protease activity